MRYTRKDSNSTKNKKLTKFKKSLLQFGKVNYEFMSILIPALFVPVVILLIYLGYFVDLIVNKRNKIKR